MSQPRAVLIEADGGSRGNPGPAAYGAVLKDADTGEVIAEDGTTIGVASNNVAEYRGLIAGGKSSPNASASRSAERSRWTSPASSRRSTRRVRLLRESTTCAASSFMRKR